MVPPPPPNFVRGYKKCVSQEVQKPLKVKEAYPYSLSRDKNSSTIWTKVCFCTKFHQFLSAGRIHGSLRSKTHKRLKEDFLIRRNRTKCAFFLFLIACVFWIFFSEHWQSTLLQIFFWGGVGGEGGGL